MSTYRSGPSKAYSRYFQLATRSLFPLSIREVNAHDFGERTNDVDVEPGAHDVKGADPSRERSDRYFLRRLEPAPRLELLP